MEPTSDSGADRWPSIVLKEPPAWTPPASPQTPDSSPRDLRATSSLQPQHDNWRPDELAAQQEVLKQLLASDEEHHRAERESIARRHARLQQQLDAAQTIADAEHGAPAPEPEPRVVTEGFLTPMTWAQDTPYAVPSTPGSEYQPPTAGMLRATQPVNIKMYCGSGNKEFGGRPASAQTSGPDKTGKAAGKPKPKPKAKPKPKPKPKPMTTAKGTAARSVAPVEVETISPGDGKTFPAVGDEVVMHYIGRLASDGVQFDSSVQKDEPFKFKLGTGAVIRGWELGVPQMSLGQKAVLRISAAAGYGAKGCEDKDHAAGTGVIPPDADLVFEVELLDINGKNSVLVLHKYRKKLDKWQSDKLAEFDKNEKVRAVKEKKYGDRAGFVDFLKQTISKKYQAERVKRGLPATEAKTEPQKQNTHPAKPAESIKEPQDGNTEEDGNAQNTKAKEKKLEFGPEFAQIKIVPNDGEETEDNMPRNLHNAAELLVATKQRNSLKRMHAATSTMLATLKAGPDGQTTQSMGRAAICWLCGYTGLPENADKCHETRTTPKATCGHCGSNVQTNFLAVMTPDGQTVPWIEVKAKPSEEALRAAAAAGSGDGASGVA